MECSRGAYRQSQSAPPPPPPSPSNPLLSCLIMYEAAYACAVIVINEGVQHIIYDSGCVEV